MIDEIIACDRFGTQQDRRDFGVLLELITEMQRVSPTILNVILQMYYWSKGKFSIFLWLMYIKHIASISQLNHYVFSLIAQWLDLSIL